MLKPSSFIMKDRGPWIMAFSGAKFYPYDPDPNEIILDDIAHSLSHLCRFVGHTRKFYSVAEHSIHVAALCSKEVRLHGLLHDASEAYISDISGPLKSKLADYKKVEAGVSKAIAQRFGLEEDMPGEVKDADRVMLVTEGHQLMPRSELWIGDYSQEPLTTKLVPMTSEKAKQVFMEEATKLLRFRDVA